MKYTYLPSPFDGEFRKNVAKLLSLAEKEVDIVTGEAGSFQYQDLKWAVRKARERGVKFKIYCSHPPAEFVNQLVRLGSEVYIGEDLPEHFFVVDGTHWMTSETRPGKALDKRSGQVGIEEESEAKQRKKEFDELIKNAKKGQIRPERDPLLQLVEAPLDLGFDTKSEELEEYL